MLFVTQPTISAQIKVLEEELGTKLFERTTKKVEMTQSAVILLKYAKKIIHLNESAYKEISKFEDSMYGDLKVGCSFTIGEYLLPGFLKSFKDDYPLIQMSVNITNSNAIISQIKDRFIDVGLIESPVEDPHVVTEAFAEDELTLIAAPGYFPDNKITIGADQIPELPFILREKGSGTRAVVNRYLQHAGISEEQMNIAMELGSTEAIKTAVASGLGVAIISKSAIKKETKLKLLKAYPIKDVSFYRDFYIAYRKDLVLKETTELFMTHLKNSMELKSEKGVS